MCHEWWLLRRELEEREAGRRVWDEFERTRPLSQPEPADAEPELTLEQPDAAELATKD
jgi:hypothetical protein